MKGGQTATSTSLDLSIAIAIFPASAGPSSHVVFIFQLPAINLRRIKIENDGLRDISHRGTEAQRGSQRANLRASVPLCDNHFALSGGCEMCFPNNSASLRI